MSSRIDTVHLVYAHGSRASCPDAIGRHVGEGLSQSYRVEYHDWDGFERIAPSRTAALLGHAHPLPFTTFRRSIPGDWGKVILLQPFSASTRVNGYLLGILDRVERFLAIMGPYWSDQLDASRFSPWLDHFEQVDLAVDPVAFPRLRAAVTEPGARRFIYIGSGDRCKNLPYLDAIAAAAPECEFSWAGTGTTSVHHIRRLGFLDFTTDAGRRMIADHDFMITVGSEDANPTTVLEAMAWGLVPITTSQSGYYAAPGLVNVPLDDVSASVRIIRALQEASSETIMQMRKENWQSLEDHYNWGRFVDQVEQALLAPTSVRRRRLLGRTALGVFWALFTPYMPYRRRGAAMLVRRARAWRRKPHSAPLPDGPHGGEQRAQAIARR